MMTSQQMQWVNWAYHESGSFLIEVNVGFPGDYYVAELIPTSQRVAMAYEASRKLGRFIDPTKLPSHVQLNAFTIASHTQWPWYKVVHYRGN
jgi:hypothetical protein